MLYAQINIEVFGVIVFASGLLVLAALRCRMKGLSLNTPAHQQRGFDNTHLNRLTSIYAPEAGKEDYCKALYSEHPSALFDMSKLQESFRRICSFKRN